LDKLPNTGDMKPGNGKVKGTNSNYVLTTYSAGTNHPQGLAWAETRETRRQVIVSPRRRRVATRVPTDFDADLCAPCQGTTRHFVL
jgi:hypothetical protein